jgi:hypothetical protein
MEGFRLEIKWRGEKAEPGSKDVREDGRMAHNEGNARTGAVKRWRRRGEVSRPSEGGSIQARGSFVAQNVLVFVRISKMLCG